MLQPKLVQTWIMKLCKNNIKLHMMIAQENPLYSRRSWATVLQANEHETVIPQQSTPSSLQHSRKLDPTWVPERTNPGTFPMTLDGGVPGDDSSLQILVFMLIYTQEEVNTSEEQIKPNQTTHVMKGKSSESSHAIQHKRQRK